MKRGLQVEWRYELPAGVLAMAIRRTRDMLSFYGRNITSLPIETLVASCYLQGVEDCHSYLEQPKPQVSDFQI